MAVRVYNTAKRDLLNGTSTWHSGTFYAVLVSSAYTYSAAHTTYANVSGSEIADADYDPVVIASPTVTGTSGTVLFDCADIEFGSDVTIDASGGHLIILKGSAASPQSGDPVLFESTLPDPASSTNGIFTITVPNGLWSIT